MLSHELRNPLAAARTALAVLDRAAPGALEATRAREVMTRQTEHLARLVDDLLDVTRVAHGKIRLRCERIDLAALARQTADDHAALLAARGIVLKLERADRAAARPRRSHEARAGGGEPARERRQVHGRRRHRRADAASRGRARRPLGGGRRRGDRPGAPAAPVRPVRPGRRWRSTGLRAASASASTSCNPWSSSTAAPWR